MKAKILFILMLIYSAVSFAQDLELKIDGNYLVIENTVTNKVEMEIPSKDVRFRIINEKVSFYDNLQNNGKSLHGKRAGYNINELKDVTTNLPYTEESVRTFLRSSTGFNSASGGSEAGNVILIDVEGVNNTFYPFNNGQNWGQIKANFKYLRFDINVSDSGSPNVTPHTIFIDTSRFEMYMSNPGWDLVEANGVVVDISPLSDGDNGFTYLQASGDVPTSGRMQFTVIGIKNL